MNGKAKQDQLSVLFKEREWLYGLARGLVLDDSAAQDLVHDTWVAALKNPPADLDRPRPWLKAVTARLAGKRSTRLSPEYVENMETTGASDEGPEETAIRVDAAKALRRAVACLDRVDREPILLIYEQNLTHEEVARVLHVSTRTVRARLSRSYEEITRRLGGEKSVKDGSWALTIGPLLKPVPRNSGGAVGSSKLVGGFVVVAALIVVGGGAMLLRAVLLQQDGFESAEIAERASILSPRESSRADRAEDQSPELGGESREGYSGSPDRREPLVQAPRVEEHPPTETKQLDEAEKALFRLSGQVLIDDGVPEGLRADLVRQDAAYTSRGGEGMDVAEDGSIELTTHAEGRWRLYLNQKGRSSRDGYPRYMTDIDFYPTAREREVSLAIKETRTVTVVIETLERVWIRARVGAKDEWQYESTGPVVDGRATFHGVPAVNYIQVRPTGGGWGDDETLLYGGPVEPVIRIE